MKLSNRLTGDLALVFVTVCWGVTFPLIENAVQHVDPFVFVTVRFFLAALILLPFLWRRFQIQKIVLVPGVILGLLNMISYGSQSKGLMTVSAAQGAFLTGISVIMVPFLLPFFKLGKPTLLDVICSLICLCGLYFLTGADLHMSTGDLWVLLCALFVAITIVYLQKVTQKISQLELLTFYQILFTGFFSSFFAFGKPYAGLLNHHALVALLFCAVIATCIALLLQTKFQRYTTANRAALIFCFEPIFGALFGYLINGERLTSMMVIGGILIVSSIFISELTRVFWEKKSRKVRE